MEKLKLQITILRKALKTLENSFKVYKKTKMACDEDVVLATEDSIIQRFEYSFDGFWKMLKKYLELNLNVENVNSPNSVFRACTKHELCSQDEGEILLDMTEKRNITTHEYNLEDVREILPYIPQYYELMVVLVDRVEEKLQKSKVACL